MRTRFLITVGVLLAPAASADAKGHACFADPVPAADWRIRKPFRAENRFKAPLIDAHEGIDIDVRDGTPVLAVAAGTVIWAGDQGDGNFIISLRLRDRKIVRFGHMSRIDVRLEERVAPGQILGLSGGKLGVPGTGPYTTGPHLHVDVHDGRKFVNPLPLFCRKTAP